MLNDMRRAKNIVKSVLESYPDTRDDDIELLFKCWEEQEIYLSAAIQEEIHIKGLRPESVRRMRQRLQEAGEFLGTKRLAKLGEADRVKDFIKSESE